MVDNYKVPLLHEWLQIGLGKWHPYWRQSAVISRGYSSTRIYVFFKALDLRWRMRSDSTVRTVSTFHCVMAHRTVMQLGRFQLQQGPRLFRRALPAELTLCSALRHFGKVVCVMLWWLLFWVQKLTNSLSYLGSCGRRITCQGQPRQYNEALYLEKINHRQTDRQEIRMWEWRKNGGREREKVGEWEGRKVRETLIHTLWFDITVANLGLLSPFVFFCHLFISLSFHLSVYLSIHLSKL